MDFPNEQSEQNTQKHGVPTILSFICPGLGQFVKGHFMKAFGIWFLTGLLAAIILACLKNFPVYQPNDLYIAVIIGVILLGIHLWNLYDAYNAN